MNILDVPLSDSIAAYCKRIVELDGDDSDHKREYTKYLIEVWLQYIQPHELANGRSYETNLKQSLNCGRCVNKVWDYFKKRFKPA